MKNTKMDGKSLNPQEELLELLKQKSPEVFSEGYVDCQKLKQTLGEDVDLENERYGMTWAGKNNCFRVIQEPTTATLKPARDESVDFDETENLFIEGDNLEVLKILQKPYYGKVKMIYIDPPYNTGNDFIYNDDFKQDRLEYEEKVGIKDDNGDLRGDGLIKNTRDRGHYHSDWLNMMFPRLFLARNLLRQDGVIFVSIDDNEVKNLRAILDEIFGEENFISQLVWKKKYTGGKHAKHYADMHEYILVYSKNIEDFDELYMDRPEDEKGKFVFSDSFEKERGKYYIRPLKSNLAPRPTLVYPITTPDGKKIETQWIVSEPTFKSMLKEERIEFKKKQNGEYQVYKKYYEKDGAGMVKIPSLIDKFPNTEAKIELKNLFGIKEGRDNLFYTVKPVNLIKYLAKPILNDDDIIVDFFCGSGTTGHAVMELSVEDRSNRRCIQVQLPEICDKESEAYKAGYKTIADITKERIRRAGKKIKDEKGKQLELDDNKLDIGFKVFKLDESNFKIWKTDVKDEKSLLEQMRMFVDNVKEESAQDNILYELILKSGLDLNVEVAKKEVEKKAYFLVDRDKLVICLEDKITQQLVDAILTEKPGKVICLDKAFGSNDQLKTNTMLQMESAKVDFKVI